MKKFKIIYPTVSKSDKWPNGKEKFQLIECYFYCDSIEIAEEFKQSIIDSYKFLKVLLQVILK